MTRQTQLVHVPKAKAKPPTETRESFQLLKWGNASKAGFQLVPNVLFRAQFHLGLDAVDLVVLLNFTLHWWGPHDFPFITPSNIAKRMGLSKRTIERRLEGLQEKGFLKKVPIKAGMHRRYELSGMVKKLESAAQVGLIQRAYSKREKTGK